jgi:hypothetical protein
LLPQAERAATRTSERTMASVRRIIGGESYLKR